MTPIDTAASMVAAALPAEPSLLGEAKSLRAVALIVQRGKRPVAEECELRVEYPDVPTVFTIGYEQHATPSTLIDALRSAGVRRLVDVRELPLSRRRGFSKTALADALRRSGIQYDHVRELGNPKPYRELYRAGRIAEGEARYRAHLHNGSYNALVELSDALHETPTCLLCFEAEHDECHRAIIVDALETRRPDLDVVHLR
jgi:uncharacterized protein (DUF488 family)